MDIHTTTTRFIKDKSEMRSSPLSQKLSKVLFDRHVIFASLNIIQVGPSPSINLLSRKCSYGARFAFRESVVQLFPLINAVIKGARYYRRPDYVRFCYGEQLCVLYSHEGAFTPVADYAEAVEFLGQLLDFLQRIRERSHEIVPDHRLCTQASPLDILRLLPKSNCQDCGYLTCLAYAAALARQQTSPAVCPHLPKPVEENTVYQLTDANGERCTTVSLPIDTRVLGRKVSEHVEYIQALEQRLEKLEREQSVTIEESNSRLIDPLTKRELEVLRMLAGGFTNRVISEQLYISENTVKTHIVHIFDKLNVNDRTQASVWAVRNGI